MTPSGTEHMTSQLVTQGLKQLHQKISISYTVHVIYTHVFQAGQRKYTTQKISVP
jgi:hypothetical protein